MFYDVLWCSMMFFDVLWCSIMFYDVLCCSMIFYDVLTMMYSDVHWCSRSSEHSWCPFDGAFLPSFSLRSLRYNALCNCAIYCHWNFSWLPNLWILVFLERLLNISTLNISTWQMLQCNAMKCNAPMLQCTIGKEQCRILKKGAFFLLGIA